MGTTAATEKRILADGSDSRFDRGTEQRHAAMVDIVVRRLGPVTRAYHYLLRKFHRHPYRCAAVYVTVFTLVLSGGIYAAFGDLRGPLLLLSDFLQ